MRLLELLQQKIGFTRNEALAVLILSGTFLIGVGIRWIQSNEARPPLKQFDYSRSDSVYAARGTTPPQPANSPALSTLLKQKTSRKANPIVNINTASKSQLMSLPGIGPSYADRIIDYRKMYGMFTSVEELSKVRGIGKKKLEKLRPFVSLR